MSTSARGHMMFWWNSVLTAASLVIICSQLLLEINIRFDHSEIKNYSTVVIEKVERRLRRSSRYYLDLTFSEKQFPYLIRVSPTVYSMTAENSQIVIGYKEGYLGYPYLVSINGAKL